MDTPQAKEPDGPGGPGGAGDILSGLRAVDQRGGARVVEQSEADFHEFVERGRSRVLAVLLARLIAVALPGPVRPVTAALSVVVMGMWPFLIALVAARLDLSHRGVDGRDRRRCRLLALHRRRDPAAPAPL